MGILIVIGILITVVVGYLTIIAFPELAAQVYSVVEAIIYYLSSVMDIVWLFVPKTITVVLMSLAIAVEIVIMGYKLVMWVLKKIPAAGIH